MLLESGLGLRPSEDAKKRGKEKLYDPNSSTNPENKEEAATNRGRRDASSRGMANHEDSETLVSRGQRLGDPAVRFINIITLSAPSRVSASFLKLNSLLLARDSSFLLPSSLKPAIQPELATSLLFVDRFSSVPRIIYSPWRATPDISLRPLHPPLSSTFLSPRTLSPPRPLPTPPRLSTSFSYAAF